MNINNFMRMKTRSVLFAHAFKERVGTGLAFVHPSSPASNRLVRSNNFYSSSSRLFEQKKTLSEMQQEATSSSLDKGTVIDEENKKESYLDLQKKTFQDLSTFFNSDEATPDDVKPILKTLVSNFLTDIIDSKSNTDDEADSTQNKDISIMDVGCGTGALFPFFIEVADEMNISNLKVVGLDLTPDMVSKAEQNAQALLSSTSKTNYTIETVQSDFVEYAVHLGDSKKKNGELFDGIIMNSVFGNFWDLEEVLSVSTKCLKCTDIENSGILCITHPLGRDFHYNLHKENPQTVKHELPRKTSMGEMCQSIPLDILNFIDDSYYYASLKKTPWRFMQNQKMKFRGKVDNGYGRGGKKLGVPTANLPESLFSKALNDVNTGVYFGWGFIESSSSSNICYPVVVNVGYSPTFQGAENPEKIIEAHFMTDENNKIENDFYGETIRLSLSGFLRPEMKFDSFPELISQINLDIQNAKYALGNVEPFRTIGDDSEFLSSADWIGKSGGDESASWEFKMN